MRQGKAEQCLSSSLRGINGWRGMVLDVDVSSFMFKLKMVKLKMCTHFLSKFKIDLTKNDVISYP